MGAFDKTQAEIEKFQTEVLQKAREALPEYVTELVRFAAISVMQGVLGKVQTFDERVTVDIKGGGTPVDTGRLRANWQIQEGSPAESAINSTDQNRPERELTEFQRTPLGAFPNVWITNNMPYGPLLESGAVKPAQGKPWRPGFVFRAVKVASEQLEDENNVSRDLLEEG